MDIAVSHCPTCKKESHLCKCPVINRGSFAKYALREVIDDYTDDMCLFLEKDCEFRSVTDYCIDADGAYKCLLKKLGELGVVKKVDRELPLITRERAESAVPETDCSMRKYTLMEREDNVRYVLYGAEIQRDKDKFDAGYVAVEEL